MSWKMNRLPSSIHDRYSNNPKGIIENRNCFIRKEHECGKAFGASKSCFIACPNDSNLDPILELLSEKLSKHGIDPVIAVRERAYGQDIFCTKICGKIIEAKFCVVFLDDMIKDNVNIPNPYCILRISINDLIKKTHNTTSKG